MGLFLSDFFGNGGVSGSTPTVVENNGYYDKHTETEQMLSRLKAGQSFSAEIVGIKGNEVQLILGDNQTITARLEQGLSLTLGQRLHFEVKGNQGGQILLRPLLTNTTQDVNVLKALDAANLPVNERTADMVKALMNEGMSIDKQSLKELYKQLVSYPQASGETIVQLNRLQIPVRPEFIGQLEAYKGFQHQLSGSLQTAMEELPKSFTEVFQNMDEKTAMQTVRQLIDVFLSQNEKVGGPQELTEELSQTKPSEAEQQIKQGTLLQTESRAENEAGPLESAFVPTEKLSGEKMDTLFSDIRNTEQFPNKQEVLTALRDVLFLAKPDGEKVFTRLMQVATPQELLRQLQQLLEEEVLPPKQVKELFSAKEFLNILKSELNKQWFIEPQNVDNKSMEELYRRIQEQANRLFSQISHFAKEESGLYKAVSNIKENVDFMNQLNQMFSYVQLPLKMANKNAHGELYVYTNKKNLAKKDGKVTALLHLDMEHLGAMDIYVALQEGKVSTKFYLQREEHLDFLEQHMHLLTERLNKRGYQIQTEVLFKEEPVNVMEEMLKQEKGGMVISQYAFDVRA